MISSTGAIVLGVCVGAINVVAMMAYGYDKWVAQSERSRIKRVPETLLHFIELVGGSLGAWIAQRAFNHKLRKRRFLVLFLRIVTLQLFLITVLAIPAWAWGGGRVDFTFNCWGSSYAYCRRYHPGIAECAH